LNHNLFTLTALEKKDDGDFLKYVTIRAFDCPDAWFKTLHAIWFDGDTFHVHYGPECGRTKKLNISVEITHPELRPLVDGKAPCDTKYVQWYALRYLWSGLKEEGETYTYGSRLREPIDQVEEAVRRYVETRNDRQVVFVIRMPEDIKKSVNGRIHEPPCLSLIDTEVCDNSLNLTCYFRSWDAYAGLPANIAGIQIFNEALVAEINQRGNLSLTTGKLIFHSKNCHIYERQFKMAEELLEPKIKRRPAYPSPGQKDDIDIRLNQNTV
jgi:thymidylate synthase